MKIVYPILFAFWYLLSLLPLWLLYVIADILYYPLYYLARYRRRVVRKNLIHSFPNKSLQEIISIEKGFYAFFCDYVVESIKLFTLSEKSMKKRMVFSGMDRVEKSMETHKLCFAYLGHYGNWEWITSLPLWASSDVKCGQIYHPLENVAVDKLFLRLRGRFGAQSISMKETLRVIAQYRKRKQKAIVGFISDQTPTWNSIHHWVDFLEQDTPVFTGTERIAKKVGATAFYGKVTRVKRGYYTCEFIPLSLATKEIPDYGLTDMYMQQLEEMIKESPCIWLWSHNRWKRQRTAKNQQSLKK